MQKLNVGLSYLWTALLLSVSAAAMALEPFVVEDIRVEGLQRTAAGTVFNYLPVKVGDRLDEALAAKAIRDLFKTGFFKDVQLEQDGQVLVVVVQERPTLAEVTFEGNKSVDTEALETQLKQIDFYQGRVFEQATLDRVVQELQRTYFGLGKYSASIEPTVTPVERNRVAVHFDISEGEVARIKEINIVGNTVYDDDELLDDFNLTTPGWFTIFTRDDQYSKQKLSGDLETLRTRYLDDGYIKFNISSTQVALSPDRKDVYITINVSEGDRYTVSDIKLAGDLVVPDDDLFKLMKIKEGDVFSRRKVTETTTAVQDRLGEDGYAFANVNAIPDIDEAAKQVALTLFVDPGKRVYVRRVNFKGNSKTRDEVMRREMRQLEGGWISTKAVERSRERLQTLGYFQEVNVETPAVPGTTDQVDVDYTVVENPSGNISAGIGYSQSQGVVFSASLNQENFLGSGKRVGFAFNNSDVNRVFSFSYTNPYWTLDGVSRGFDMYYRETDAQAANVSDYTTDRLGGAMNFGIPINEFDRVFLGIGLENTNINLGSFPSTQIQSFIQREGDRYTNWHLTAGWARDTRNRSIFPDRGALQRFDGEMSLPGSDLTYYKLTYSQSRYFPIFKETTLMLKGRAGYGDGYGSTQELPFFENFYAGGIRSVRGFADNSLGGRDSNLDPLGGDLVVEGTAEMIMPLPFLKESKSVRWSAFVDAGQVFSHGQDFDGGDMRTSVGVGMSWLSPLGALTFSVAKPINDKSGDDLQPFQFTFGQLF